MERGAGCPRASCHPTGTPRRTWESFWTRGSRPGNPGPAGPEGLEGLRLLDTVAWYPAPDSVGSRGSQGLPQAVTGPEGPGRALPSRPEGRVSRGRGFRSVGVPSSPRARGALAGRTCRPSRGPGPGSRGPSWGRATEATRTWTEKFEAVLLAGNRQGRLQLGSEGNSRHHRGSRGFHSAPASDRGFRRNVYSRSRGPESSELLAVVPAKRQPVRSLGLGGDPPARGPGGLRTLPASTPRGGGTDGRTSP